MAKRPSIIETLTVTPPADTATIVDIAARRSERAEAVQHTSVYIPRPAYERLREIAFVERRKIHDLVMEGLDAVIAKRGHPETASRTKA
jgi:hypothetical protein